MRLSSPSWYLDYFENYFEIRWTAAEPSDAGLFAGTGLSATPSCTDRLCADWLCADWLCADWLCDDLAGLGPARAPLLPTASQQVKLLPARNG
ncbi:hypothetical protein, partial [Frankia sp. CiP3]|uniref:hypothetical protein n=1 Tax=Frankia sp. CiP3 TaxID=2880971 RepID=UPI001EF58A85